MKRIVLIIFAILLLIAALTFFTYSVDSYADGSTGAPTTTPAGVTPAALGESAAATPTPPTAPIVTVPTDVAKKTSQSFQESLGTAAHEASATPVPSALPTTPDLAVHSPANSVPTPVASPLVQAPPTQTPEPTVAAPAPTAAPAPAVKPAAPAATPAPNPDGVPTCMMVCEKVCTTLKDETAKELGD